MTDLSADERYDELLGLHLAMNRQTWNALQGHGVVADTELRLDFSFDAPDGETAASLDAFLYRETDYDSQHRVYEHGGSSRWIVEGQTQPTVVTLEILDQWVDWMIVAGLEHGCRFDGWGAKIGPL